MYCRKEVIINLIFCLWQGWERRVHAEGGGPRGLQDKVRNSGLYTKQQKYRQIIIKRK